MEGHKDTDVTNRGEVSVVRSKRSRFGSLRRPNKWLAIGVALVFGGIGAALIYVSQAATDNTIMYRLTNGSRYFYTISGPEKDFIVGTLKWTLQSSTPYTNPNASLPIHVHKLQLKSDGNSWVFTTNAKEVEGFVNSGLWKYQGIGFTSATSSTVPVGFCRQPWHRLQSKEALTKYVWTANTSEKDSLIASGKWTNQGVGFNLDYSCTSNPTQIPTSGDGAVQPKPTTPSTGTPPPPTTANACDNTSLKKANGTYWTCTFFDEFNGTALDTSKWYVMETAKTGYKSGNVACMVNSPNNVSVSGGALSLTARKEPAPIPCNRLNANNTAEYTGATINTYGGFSQTYGRFEVRGKILGAKAKGLQTAFWMMPVNGNKYRTDSHGYAWPSSGEIDIAEIYGHYPDRAIPYMHYVYDPKTTNTTTNVNVATNNYCLIDDIAKFHTYTVEWTSESITIIYDGKVCVVNKWKGSSGLVDRQPFDSPFMIILSQLLGVSNNGNGFEPGVTPLPATTQVDYVRVWK